MSSTEVLDLKGKKVGEVELEETVFGIEPSKGALHTALVRQLANARSGSACTLTRSEVRGGGRKPWRQKGTGRARVGSIRSPLWNGGGVIFGPKPRNFSQSMPKKMRRVAMRSALTVRKDDIVVVKDFDSVKEAKTKAFNQILKDLNLVDQKVLVVLDFECESCKHVQLSARNIAGVKVIHASNINVKDMLEADKILTSERTLGAINSFLKTEPKEKKAKEPAKKAKAPAKKKAEAPKKAKAAAPKKEAKPKEKKTSTKAKQDKKES
ncbi:MAG: 50S ribosomal protein L4 [Candidatus Obscuribacterales bacterium]|nr:50S ribosomal protein L4 [Cyanobacteria bacterium HKST-UBA01]MCB9467826.1 50S ribosomal protein L4 [Candidatus Obscuribacterales bacterium]